MTGEDRLGRLLDLSIGDDPESWVAAGFAVQAGSFDVGGVAVHLVGADGGRGILGWHLEGIDAPLDGLPELAPRAPLAPGAHPNGVVSIDHVVVGSDNLDRTTDALAAHGIELRKTRDFEREGVVRQQRFFWLGSVILELIGRADPKPPAAGAATFWGLAFTVEDIDETCRVLGDRTSSHRSAIQPGRRISTLRSDELGTSVPVAFMSAHVT